MAKRTKTVFRNADEVAHQWAARWDDPDAYGRTPNLGNSRNFHGKRRDYTGPSVHFHGDTITSYETPMARILRHPAHAAPVVFIAHHTNPRYDPDDGGRDCVPHTMTTNRHIAAVRDATRHLSVYIVDDVTATPEAELVGRARAADRLCHQFEHNPHKRRDCRAKQWQAWRAAVLHANTFAESFGLGLLAVPADAAQEAELARIADRDAKAQADRDRKRREEWERYQREAPERERIIREDRERADRARAERAEKRKRTLPDRIASFRAGESIDFDYGELPTDLMRIRGSRVETSRHAVVPLEDVRRAARQILTILNRSLSWKPADVRFGAFALREITTDGTVIVGCHRFARDEILRLGRTLGIVPTSADTIPPGRRLILHPESETRRAVDTLLSW